MRGLRLNDDFQLPPNPLSTETEPRFEGIETNPRIGADPHVAETETEPRFEGIETVLPVFVLRERARRRQSPDLRGLRLPSHDDKARAVFLTETEPRFEGIETDCLLQSCGLVGADGDRAPI